MKTLVIGIGFCNKITMQGFGQTWIDSWLDIQVYYPGIFSRHAMYLAVFLGDPSGTSIYFRLTLQVMRRKDPMHSSVKLSLFKTNPT